MTAKEASYLFIGQQIEWSDGRIATVQENDSDKQQIRMQFQDGSIGVNQYVDMFQASLIEVT
jgi:hypothetical protein